MQKAIFVRRNVQNQPKKSFKSNTSDHIPVEIMTRLRYYYYYVIIIFITPIAIAAGCLNNKNVNNVILYSISVCLLGDHTLIVSARIRPPLR